MGLKSPFSVHALAKTAFPKSFFSTIHTQLAKMYEDTYKYAQDRYILTGYAHTAIPYDRWIMADIILINVAQRFGIEVRTRPNKARNCIHAELCINDIVLTTNRVTDKNKPPREAHYRNTLAKDNHIWLPGVEPATPKDGRFYLVLAHMPLEEHIEKLGLLRLGAPSHDNKKYIDYIDIYNAEASQRVKPEIITDNAKPKLRVISKHSGA